MHKREIAAAAILRRKKTYTGIFLQKMRKAKKICGEYMKDIIIITLAILVLGGLAGSNDIQVHEANWSAGK